CSPRLRRRLFARFKSCRPPQARLQPLRCLVGSMVMMRSLKTRPWRARPAWGMRAAITKRTILLWSVGGLEELNAPRQQQQPALPLPLSLNVDEVHWSLRVRSGEAPSPVPLEMLMNPSRLVGCL
ncbi:hypothetical protein FOZ63_009203, partial [Perkinsus olseni]